LDEKHRLRAKLRQDRREHFAALPEHVRALIFLRPPKLITDTLPDKAVIGLYHAMGEEAPTRAYAKWFMEQGWRIALPWFAAREEPMRFRIWQDPHADSGLVEGPYRALQPQADARQVLPDVLFVPLVGFTAQGDRLGQGGGHYDRWLAANPGARAIGLGWDCQLLPTLPHEPHDRRLDAIITPTRLYQAQLYQETSDAP
jgi:5-formyltetrahydrofolate cyclo-ligase